MNEIENKIDEIDNKNHTNNDNKLILKNYYYECFRCKHTTKQIGEMKKHLERKNICIKKDNNCDLYGKELYDLSIKKRYKNEEEIKKLFEENNKNKENINTELESDLSKKTENIICDYCKKNYSSRSNLNVHLRNCNVKKLIEKDIKKKETLVITNNYNIQNIHNNQNILNNQNIQNNIIINIGDKDMKKESVENLLLPFFEIFDSSHIDDQKHIDLVLSNLYIETLGELLKNSVNLNYILYEDKETSLIFKNEDEKYVSIDNIKIYGNLILKIKKYLLEGIEKIKILKPYYHPDIINVAEHYIKKKYNDYIRDEDSAYIEKFKNELNRKSKEFANDAIKKYENFYYKLENKTMDNLISNV